MSDANYKFVYKFARRKLIKIVRERKILNAMITTLDVQPFNFN